MIKRVSYTAFVFFSIIKILTAQPWHELKLDVPGFFMNNRAYALGYEYQMNKHFGINLEMVLTDCCRDHGPIIPEVYDYRQELVNISLRKHFFSKNKSHSAFGGLGVMYISKPRHPQVDNSFKNPEWWAYGGGYSHYAFYYQHGFAFSGTLGYKATIKKQLILEPSLWVNRNFIAYSVDPFFHAERRFDLVAIFFKLGYRFSPL